MAALVPEEGTVLAGKYRLLGHLGQGGFGTVFEAVNLAVGKHVAVKVLNADLSENPEFARRFDLEARPAALINHPGIIDVLDTGRAEQGSRFLVMELLQGVTLNKLLQAMGPMSPGHVSALIAPGTTLGWWSAGTISRSPACSRATTRSPPLPSKTPSPPRRR